MKMNNHFEATFVRIVGLLGFILATVAFLLTMSGMTDYYGQDSGSILFMSFIMCMALAFVGLMISTLAQLLRSSRNMESMAEVQTELLKQLAANSKATPAKKAAAPKAKKKTVAAQKTTASKTAAKKTATKKKAAPKKTTKK